ncbi:Csu type fimbrial protein [Yersinia enterocolitica]|nr:spore coat U domain-containing protein [Yersinia enterocolitica]EKN5072262.1 spore coat U domain-containing protein [Yersinia enterocolitica]EKN5088652.1 spore coat U domain-containing protein [Yersinia enterocolitica]EKN5097074.1 spore coat U domain-containing protein [Yersinia enterocolitica]EKN5110483.1 spore coat U domain-containing protein [Yersinia enterocolitica]
MIKEEIMKKPLLILGAMVLLQAAPSVESAGTVTGTLGATLTIITGCYINDGTNAGGITNLGTINFGTVSTLNTRIRQAYSSTANGALNLYCSAGTTYNIGIDNGAHALLAQRRLAGGTTEFVNYNLYKDNGYSQAWGATGSDQLTGTAVAISTAIPLTIYGEVPTQTTPSVSTYADTVNVTVSW